MLILLATILKEVFATLPNPVAITKVHGAMAGPLNFRWEQKVNT